MTVKEFNRFVQKAIKEPLAPEEQARVDEYLADNPEALIIWEEELGLNDLLDTAADFPVSSNFTAQVLQAVERETTLEREERASLVATLLSRHWSIPAVALGLVGLLAVGVNQHQLQARRVEVAETIAAVSTAADMATLEMLRDFDAVTSFGQVPSEVDEELGAVLGDGLHPQLSPPVPGSPFNASPVPPLPGSSPVRQFGALLKLAPADRDSFLSSFSPRKEAVLREKVAQYTALPESELQNRLFATETRWYLKQLAPLEGLERQAMLDRVPPELRASIHARLTQWDQLSPGWRQEILQHERTMTWLQLQKLSEPAEPRPATPQLFNWSALELGQKKEFALQFLSFIEMSRDERGRVLEAMPTDQRMAVIPIVEKFDRMSPEDRSRCLDSLGRLAELPEAVRNRVLTNARQWQELTSEERQTWRNIVTKFPPLPPGLSPARDRVHGIPYPPLPPGLDLPTMPPAMTLSAR